jgi:formate dehydrogenase maturation protein FdhE
MEPSDSIGKLGFRKWYERQLIEAHAWFVSCFLCVIAVAVLAEELNFRSGAFRGLIYFLLIVATVLTASYAWRRYLATMSEAERLAERSVCPGCGAYGIFYVSRVPRGSVMDVRCRRCSADWTIE